MNSNRFSAPHNDTAWSLMAVLVGALIIYGSLYPFDFRPVANLSDALQAFIGTMRQMPGRGDFISNILFYAPLGFCVRRVFLSTTKQLRTTILVVLIAAILSLFLELTQFYDDGRVTAATDTYANIIGAAIGALLAAAYGDRIRMPSVRPVLEFTVPLTLLACWAAYRLYPFVPVIDLHKYWNALKPLILSPNLDGVQLFRDTATWLGVAKLVESVTPHRTVCLFGLFVIVIFAAEVFIDSQQLSIDEVGGAFGALLVWFGIRIFRPRTRNWLVALVFLAGVVIERLEPFEFESPIHGFQWMPFYSFMHGSIDVAIQSFFQKCFLYGTAIWALGQTGLRAGWAAMIVAALLAATSWAEIYLPGRSAEITDTLIALFLGVILVLIEVQQRLPPKSTANRPNSHIKSGHHL